MRPRPATATLALALAPLESAFLALSTRRPSDLPVSVLQLCGN